MFKPRRFVRLADSAEGHFEDFIEAESNPIPLVVDEALSLNDYVQSFYTEIFDWSEAANEDVPGHPRPADLPAVDSIAVDDTRRTICWSIRLWARLNAGDEPRAVIGFGVNPRLTQRQFYIWTYLLLAIGTRERKWDIFDRESQTVLDWRGFSSVQDGIYDLRQNGSHMIVNFSRPSTLFPRGAIAASSLSSVTSGSSRSKKVSRSTTPKEDIRARDDRCLLTGSLLNEDSGLGEPIVSHILPCSQGWLADCLRLVLDPTAPGFKNRGPQSWRYHSPNHPSNLVMLRSNAEKLFDAFRLAVDVFGVRPMVCSFGYQDRQPLSDREIARMGTDDYQFPILPFTSNSIPGPSSSFFLVHLISVLATTSRLRMIDEVDYDPSQDGSIEISRAYSPPTRTTDMIVDWLGRSDEFATNVEDDV